MQEEGASMLAPDLQKQIDETLEEITPRCVLELLALPLNEEYRRRREEGLQGVRNILWTVGGGGAAAIAGGFTREDFMKEAFSRMTATEQVCIGISIKRLFFCCFTLSFSTMVPHFILYRWIYLLQHQVIYQPRALKFMGWHLPSLPRLLWVKNLT